MQTVTATQLALHLGLSKARVSQYVAEGKLEGCFAGEGRARRFDLAAVAQKLNRTLDAGQMLGNGSDTKRTLKTIMLGAAEGETGILSRPTPAPRDIVGRGRDEGELPETDPDRYEMARTLKVEQEARRLLKQNELEEGTLVLASEAARETAKRLGQEIAEFEQFLREAARRQADEMGIDYKSARQVLMQAWRAHRAARSAKLGEDAAAATMTADEAGADI